MKLKKLIAKNFLTYESLEYDFVNKPLMIQGLNLTDDKQKSNGSGKSSIQSMIEFCYTGDNSRGVRDKELVRFGCNEAFLDLFTLCDFRKEELHISWKIKVKGSNVLNIFKKSFDGDWEEVVFSNVNDGKKWILNWLSITKEDLFNYFIINKTRFKSFFKSSNKEKVELINRFSDASVIDGIEDINTDEMDSKYDGLRDDILKNEGKIQLLNESLLKELERDFDKEYDDKLEEINEENSDIEEEIEDLNSNILEKNNKISSNDLKISKILEGKPTKRLLLKKTKSKVDNINNSIIDLNKSVVEAQKAVDDFKKTNFESLRKIFEDQKDLINNSIESKEELLKKGDGNLTKVLKAIKKIDLKLSGSITCPSCSHKFILDGDISVDELESNKKKIEKLKCSVDNSNLKLQKDIKLLELDLKIPQSEIDKLNLSEDEEINVFRDLLSKVNDVNAKINVRNNELNSLILDVNKIDSQIKGIDDTIDKIKSKNKYLVQDIKGLESDISNYKKEIESNINLLSSLEKGNNKDIIDDINSNIYKITKDNLSKEKRFKELEDELYVINQWKNNFKQFKMHIANKSLETIEFHCNRYLKGMGSDLRAKFDGYRVLANGNIKDEITAKVIRNDERTFGSFSGGEQGRLLFASILSNRHMINETHPFGGLQFLSIDEVFEGVDSLGLQSLVQEAKKLQECIMIITHVSDENVSEDILRVVKINGISKIN